MTSPFRTDVLAGKRILITGGGTGLGKGVAGHLVLHGAQVHLWGRRPAVSAAAEAAGGCDGVVHWQVVDVRKADLIDAAKPRCTLEPAWAVERSHQQCGGQLHRAYGVAQPAPTRRSPPP